jgi:tyrosinase
MVRLRKDVSSFDGHDDTLTWYARAVGAMKRRPIADPTSWRYQAAIHEYTRETDPLASDADKLPSAADQQRFWSQCQHGSFYFLPWHRMYLHHFEAIVAREVKALGGPEDWALPYWNYSAGAASRLLPAPFRAPKLRDGTPNALYVEQRDPRCDAGEPFAHARDVDVKVALKQHVFESPAPGLRSSFGGPLTKFEHSGSAPGALELTPHGSMHVAVGGAEGGWMSAFNTAALDPIFWLHHANIDRLWQVWLHASGHANPSSSDWLRSVSFEFHDASGAVVSMVPADVLDPGKPPLSYAYDDAGLTLTAEELAIIGAGRPMAKPLPPEMIGATDAPIRLTDASTHAAFETVAPTGPGLAAGPGQRRWDAADRIFLHIENLTSTRRVPAYDVYLNVPAGAEPAEHEDKFVGRLPMFGLVEASRAQGKHSGAGLHYVLDVTDAVKALAAQPGWNPSQLRVSFAPSRRVAGAHVDVGRVSLFVE